MGPQQTVTNFHTDSRASLRSAAGGSACPRCAAGRFAYGRSTLPGTPVRMVGVGDDPTSQDLHDSDRHQGRFASLRDGLRPPLTPITAEQLG